MNIYKKLNEITKYIEDNLEQEINYEILARFLGVNVYTMQRFFTMIADISLSEYIRKRRLSNAGFDLYNSKIKIIDLAIKYQYDNATSFSRAFERFHGVKPSLVSKNSRLKNFPRIVFCENVNTTIELDYEIIELCELNLYGICIKTTNNAIGTDAPLFVKTMKKKYGNIEYGMTTYTKEREECEKYYCLYDKKMDNFEHIKIPPSKWLKFKIDSRNSNDIQEKIMLFYQKFLPSCKYNLKELPELEYYHEDRTDFLVAIY